ncbi:MAG: U32 family peptidase [Oscillatoriales cyanobacterium SM2_2_1]|nr:U32 family peptidase [Oscillatoriales cyanobacterium SM2_2_1]
MPWRSRRDWVPELLAPAGNWACARAAVENGADAIYFGLEHFNARMRADNFSVGDLPDLMAFVHGRGVRGYVTINTLIFTAELAAVESYLRATINAGVDGVIVQDVGLCRLIRHLSPDVPIHASTQMTITSGAGVAFAAQLGCDLVVLARECAIAEIQQIYTEAALPLEVFVHGALCVAYSGQCLTSESLGGRSANRGECAQACRMPYELVVDGAVRDLGDRRYLLSPQDLAGISVLPELVAAGVSSLKIEGRLKTPEYVASVTRIYRQALDRLGSDQGAVPTVREHYELEMAFSRGLSSGWFRGIDNQTLVHGIYAKKRGAYIGAVVAVQREQIQVAIAPDARELPLQPGDGVVFACGDREFGGRIHGLERQGQRLRLSLHRSGGSRMPVRVGDRLWKTSDPELDKRIRQSFAGTEPRFQRPLWLEVSGGVGDLLTLTAWDELGHRVTVASAMPLAIAQNQPLTPERLSAQLGRLGTTPFYLEHLSGTVDGIVPVSELNRLRRQVVEALLRQRQTPHAWTVQAAHSYRDLLPDTAAPSEPPTTSTLIVLGRSLEQVTAALEAGITMIYCDFEDPRQYRRAVQRGQAYPQTRLYVAPPRITKPKEQWILEQVRRAEADGYLVRNYDHLAFFAGERMVADFSLNIANPITAAYFWQHHTLERLTASYDLNAGQLVDLLTATPRPWWEITIHQHMPMFHMEHCVFCAFLSTGTDYTNCGRPCDKHEVTLRDRTGAEHLLKADVGCRNTVFNATAQTGAELVPRLQSLGVRHWRIEFVQESPTLVQKTIQRYQALLQGHISGAELWRELQLTHQLGVTRGTF